MVEVTDSGFTPENIADAEWLWINLPTFPRNWSSLPTHEKALIVHTAARLRIEAAKAERDRIVAWLRNLPNEMVGSIAKKHFVSFEVAKLIGRDLATAFEKEQQP